MGRIHTTTPFVLIQRWLTKLDFAILSSQSRGGPAFYNVWHMFDR